MIQGGDFSEGELLGGHARHTYWFSILIVLKGKYIYCKSLYSVEKLNGVDVYRFIYRYN